MKKIIEEVLESNISSTQLARDTGLSRQLIDKYRQGKSSIDNMTIKNAQALLDYYNNSMKEAIEELED